MLRCPSCFCLIFVRFFPQLVFLIPFPRFLALIPQRQYLLSSRNVALGDLVGKVLLNGANSWPSFGRDSGLNVRWLLATESGVEIGTPACRAGKSDCVAGKCMCGDVGSAFGILVATCSLGDAVSIDCSNAGDNVGFSDREPITGCSVSLLMAGEGAGDCRNMGICDRTVEGE